MVRKKKRGRKPVDEMTFYVIGLESWDWGYSFGVNSSRHIDDPYNEYRHLEIKGRILRPHMVQAEGAELALLPDIKLNEANRARDEPRCVGSLSVHRGILRGLLAMPGDALTPVLQMLIADRFRYVVMDGARLRYRQALIRHYRIDSVYDDDDLPPDE